MAVVILGACAAVGHASGAGDWPSANGNLSGTRSTSQTPFAAANVHRLTVRWRFAFTGNGGDFGRVTSTPVAVGDTVYVQDTRSSVFALERATGRLRWARRNASPNDGPNGLSVVGGRVYSATDTTAFALDAATGRPLWSRRLTSATEQFIDIAPVVASGRVYLSTVGFAPGGRGAIYSLDAANGAVRWRFDTIAEPWPTERAGGGGAWNPLSVDRAGRVYAGISNPGPWGGTRKLPNGGTFPGAARYTDSLVVLDGSAGRLLWADQVTAHDVRDYDFQASPILARVRRNDVTVPMVFGAGKAGRVIAWNRTTHQRLWSQPVGTHLNDLGPLPATEVRVCPGLFGGVLSSMAYANGRLFVPTVELCMQESSVTAANLLQRPPEGGRGVLYAIDAATGRKEWSRRFATPLFGCATVARDVVFVPGFDGSIVGLSTRDGRTLWSARARAGINSCPSVAGGLLLVGAGAPHSGIHAPVAELIAYGLPDGAR